MNPMKQKILQEIMEAMSAHQGMSLKSRMDSMKKPMGGMPGMADVEAHEDPAEMMEDDHSPKGISMEKVELMGKKDPDEMSMEDPMGMGMDQDPEMSDEDLKELMQYYMSHK